MIRRNAWRCLKNPTQFLQRFITVNEKWIHHYIQESEQHSKQWIEANGSAPEKAKTVHR